MVDMLIKNKKLREVTLSAREYLLKKEFGKYKALIKENLKQYVYEFMNYIEIPSDLFKSIEKKILYGGPLPYGLPFRLPIHVWKDIYSKEEEFLLKELGNFDYAFEWISNSNKNMELVSEVANIVNLGDANNVMNEAIALSVYHYLSTIKEKKINLIDVGCGSLSTSTQVLNKIRTLDLEEINIYLLDLSTSHLDSYPLFQSIKGSKARTYVKFFDVDFNFPSTLRKLRSEKIEGINIIVSNASLHHTNDLGEIFNNLSFLWDKNLSLFALGEWTHTLHEEINNVRMALYVLEGDMKLYKQLSNENRKMLNFWLALIGLYKFAGETSPIIYFEGHRNTQIWKEQLKKAGFSIKNEAYFNDGLNYILVGVKEE